ncbi:MAG: hypothetical protein QM679_04925 [Patulibacter sp.]
MNNERQSWNRDDAIVFLASMIPLIVAVLGGLSDTWMWIFVGFAIVLIGWRLVTSFTRSRRP